MKTISAINSPSFEKKIKAKFPFAYNEFVSLSIREVSLQSFIDFFKKYKIEISYSLTNALKENYIGTYNFKVTIKNIVHLKKLNRTINSFSYYGVASGDKAAIKAITKAFEILECLKSGKQMTQRIRRSVPSHR